MDTIDTAKLPAWVGCILAPNPSLMTGPGTNTFLVSGPPGGCVVIDPGPAIESHLVAIAAAAKAHGGLNAILITHGHPDHVEGAARLRELTGARIYAWSRDGSPDADESLTDGQTITVAGRTLRALHTPGHRFDHLSFLLEDASAIFAGDLVAGTGTVVIAPPEGDLADYMASLQRLLALDPRLILPAHGPLIEQPRALLEHYIQHRNEREAQVIAGLAEGPCTVDALVAAIYSDVDPALHPMAALSITAHLQKLKREGRVTRSTGDSGAEMWQLR
ncbi:MAG: MBL fold metallo-hydrolase [Ktedonobacterales bacterium]